MIGGRHVISSISEANQIAGSQTGSQRRQTPGDAERRPATITPANWLFRRQRAMSSDGWVAPYKRGVTGSNPVAPPPESRPRRGYREDSMYFDHANNYTC